MNETINNDNLWSRSVLRPVQKCHLPSKARSRIYEHSPLTARTFLSVGQECKARGGAMAGSCAGGFGVCCVFSLSCGGSSAENCTYLTTDTSSSQCVYTICKRSDEVALLRRVLQSTKSRASIGCSWPYSCQALAERLLASILGFAVLQCSSKSYLQANLTIKINYYYRARPSQASWSNPPPVKFT